MIESTVLSKKNITLIIKLTKSDKVKITYRIQYSNERKLKYYMFD